jgi:hypothetical protein
MAEEETRKRLEMKYYILEAYNLPPLDNTAMNCITQRLRDKSSEHRHSVRNPRDITKHLAERVYLCMRDLGYEEAILYSSITDDVKNAPKLGVSKYNRIAVEGPTLQSMKELLEVQKHLAKLLNTEKQRHILRGKKHA